MADHRRATRLAIIAAACIAGGLAAGCGSHPMARGHVSHRSEAAARPPAAGPQPPRAHAFRDAPVPPGLDPAEVAPKRDEALARARTPHDAAVAAAPKPDYLTPGNPGNPVPPGVATSVATPTRAPDTVTEPEPASQRAYAHARELWRERRGFDAIRELEKAEALTPGDSAILRLLGQIYTATANRVRGAAYLERAVVADPADADSLYLLGRFAAEAGRWPVAVAIFAHALSLEGAAPDADPGLWPLLRYSLAGALKGEGYDAAAAEEYGRLLRQESPLGQGTRYARELSLLWRERDSVYQALGDAYARLDDPARAAEAYEAAADLFDTQDLPLTRRLVYARLRIGRPEAAVAAFLSYLTAGRPDAEAIALSRYLAEQGADARLLAGQLRGLYEGTDRPGPLAVAIAELMPAADAGAFLRDHMAQKPDDLEVFDALVRRAVAGGQPGEAVAAAADAIDRRPDAAAIYADRLLAAEGAAEAVRAGWPALPAALTDRPAALFVEASASLRAGDADAARAEFERVVSLRDYLPARVALARLAVKAGDAPRAAELLRGLEASERPDVLDARVEVLAATGRGGEALALLDRVLARQPQNTDLLLRKSRLQRDTGDAIAAERTLLDALDARPQEEPIYAALFDLYGSPQAPADSPHQTQRLPRRLLDAIPQSHLARLKRGEWMAAAGQYEPAEKAARELLAESPRDRDTLRLLIYVLQQTNRRAETTPYLEQMLLLDPPSPLRAGRLGLVYLTAGQPERAVAVLEEGLAGDKIEKPGPLLSLLARGLVAVGRPEEAERRLREAAARWPDQADEINLILATHLDRRGRRDEAERVMLANLEAHPGHAATQNALGYGWADRGIHLDRARELLEAAQQADPSNAAILDSLGWVHYKRGDFNEAVKWLGRARASRNGDYPVILAHLGDAFFRAGKSDAAVEAWRRAQTRLSQEDDAGDDPELAGLAERLRARLEAVQQGRPPSVADVPTPADAQEPPPAGDPPRGS